MLNEFTEKDLRDPALGHSSKAVHHAYAKHAMVICPSLDMDNDKVIRLPESSEQELSVEGCRRR